MATLDDLTETFGQNNPTVTAPWGPVSLGRGVIVSFGVQLPAGLDGIEVVVVDDATVRAPAVVVERLHRAWALRERIVVSLGCDPASFREPRSFDVEPWQAGARFEPLLDRLHFLVWANNVDARTPGAPIWWWGRKAERLGCQLLPAGGDGDVVLNDGSTAWIDGGPRSMLPSELGQIIHRESIDLGRLNVAPVEVATTASLAPDQLGAVTHGSGPARVIAPAGSGKTRVLTERLRVLLRDRQYEPGTVTAVAYNVKARAEMQNRTADLPSANIKTLNALCLSLLNDSLGRQTVLDEREVRRIVDDLVEIPQSRRKANTDPLSAYIEALSSVRLGLRDPAEVEASRDDVDGFADMFDGFRRELAKRNAVDFDEQIYRGVQVLLQDGTFRQRAQQSCRHLLVDEFQDLTPAHILLLRLLCLPSLDCFGVGDDDQVIYGHAGANPIFLLEFEKLFPTATAYALEVNYRSSVPIVTAAKTLLGYNDRRIAKEIRPAPEALDDPTALVVRPVASASLASEAVRIVQGWVDEGVTVSDIAVLTRVNAQLLAPQVALSEARFETNHAVFETILERAGLRACLAYLRMAVSPRKVASGDVIEVLKRPSYGLPPWFAERVRRKKTWSLTDLRGIGATMTAREVDKLDRLVDNLDMLALIVKKGGHVSEVLRAIRDVVGLDAAMELLDNSKRSEGSSHLDDLDALLQVAALEPDPERFEAWLRSALRKDAPSPTTSANGNPSANGNLSLDDVGLTLATIHKVKGREWSRVLLFGVNEGVLPHRLSEDDEEERRVLHVGITRGRSQVVVLTDEARPSSMIGELDGSALRRSSGSASLRMLAEKAGVPLMTRPPGGSIPSGVAPEDEPIFEALRAWRRERASKDKVSAFIIASDKTLRAIVAAKPTSIVRLANVEGIGPTKLDNFGDEILEVLRSIGIA